MATGEGQADHLRDLVRRFLDEAATRPPTRLWLQVEPRLGELAEDQRRAVLEQVSRWKMSQHLYQPRRATGPDPEART